MAAAHGAEEVAVREVCEHPLRGHEERGARRRGIPLLGLELGLGLGLGLGLARLLTLTLTLTLNLTLTLTLTRHAQHAAAAQLARRRAEPRPRPMGGQRHAPQQALRGPLLRLDAPLPAAVRQPRARLGDAVAAGGAAAAAARREAILQMQMQMQMGSIDRSKGPSAAHAAMRM